MPIAELVVSITSIPERVELFLGALGWLAGQTVRPRAAVIWLGDESFPEARRHELAARFALPPWVELRYRPDLGPQTKLLHALREFPEQAIVTADDDVLYPSDWLAGLDAAYRAAPAYIHCYRAHGIRLTPEGRLAPYSAWDWESPGVRGPSLLLFPTGTSGTLYPPGSLDQRVWDLETMRRLCPTNDDTWFKAMALLRGAMARKIGPDSRAFPHIPGSETRMLWTVNAERNDAQLNAVFEHYGLLSILAAQQRTHDA